MPHPFVSDPVAAIVAAVIGSVPSTIAAVHARATHREVRPSPAPAGEEERSNGQTLSDLLHELLRMEGYQRTRNHDVLQGETVIILMLGVMADALAIELPPMETMRQFAEWRILNDRAGGR